MVFTEIEITQLMKALRFAADKHRGQQRKDAEASPYINHLIEVTVLLWEVGGVRTMPTLIAALLHDVLEDTPTTTEEIREIFGKEVLALVQEVTDDRALTKEECKQQQIARASQLSLAARQIKLADKLSNIRDTTVSSPRHWSRERKAVYLDWAEQVVAGLRGCNHRLETKFDESLKEARNRLFGEASQQEERK